MALFNIFISVSSLVSQGWRFFVNKELKAHSKMTIGNSSSFKGMQSNILFSSGALIEDHMLVFNAIKSGRGGKASFSVNVNLCLSSALQYSNPFVSFSSPYTMLITAA